MKLVILPVKNLHRIWIPVTITWYTTCKHIEIVICKKHSKMSPPRGLPLESPILFWDLLCVCGCVYLSIYVCVLLSGKREKPRKGPTMYSVLLYVTSEQICLIPSLTSSLPAPFHTDPMTSVKKYIPSALPLIFKSIILSHQSRPYS